MELLADGIWRWTARHPEWHPKGWGAEVASFALRSEQMLLLIDPQLPADEGPVLDALDALADGGVAVITTMPYHVRSSERLAGRYGCPVHGHPHAARRMSDSRLLAEVRPGDELPGGVRAFAVGRPRRDEMPLAVPAVRAVVFGDTVVGTDDGLRMWSFQPVDEVRARWYAERFAPTLEPLATLEPEHVLVTHGPSAIGDGASALRRAMCRPPWYRG